MKAVVERAALVRAMGEAARVVQARNTIPILSNVKIEAEPDALRLTATDLDLQISVPVAARVETPGATTAPAHRLASIVASLPEGCQIGLSLADGKLTVTGGRSRFVLPVLPVDQFPVLSQAEAGVDLTMPAAQLRAFLDFAAPAICRDMVKPYMMGVCLEIGSGFKSLKKPALIGTATDGHRAARAAIQPPPVAALDGRPIIPLRAVETIIRLAEAGGDVDVTIGTRMIAARFGEIALISKLIEGDFPEAERGFRDSSTIKVIVDPQMLITAAKRVTQVATEKTRCVKLDFAGEMVTLSCISPEYGTATEEMPAIMSGADSLSIGCNAAYLADALAGFAGDEVELGFEDAGSAIMFRSTKKGDAAFLGVIMPMRV